MDIVLCIVLRGKTVSGNVLVLINEVALRLAQTGNCLMAGKTYRCIGVFCGFGLFWGLGCFGVFGILGYLGVLGVWTFWRVWGFWGVWGLRL